MADIAIGDLPVGGTLTPAGSVIVEGPETEIFTSKRFAEYVRGKVLNIEDFGASPSASAAVNTAAITAAATAASAAGGGTVFVPPRTYDISGSLPLLSRVHWLGCGRLSVLKVASATPFNILSQTSSNLEDVVIDGLGFDGSLNYPASSQVYQFGGTFPLNRAIAVSRTLDVARVTNDIKNLTIRNCYFNQMSSGSIFLEALNIEDVAIRDNYFTKGTYQTPVVWVRTRAGFVATQRARRVLVSDNHSDTSGPQIFYDASKDDYVASSDGIQLDRVIDSIVSNNLVHKAASIGIRVEESSHVVVVGNTVTESGNEGIAVYKSCWDVAVVGNVVKSWGRTPPAYAIRDFAGTLVVAREFPRSTGPTLPADPTASAWFDIWPCSTANINLATIIAYSDTDYFTGTPSSGILPFRGNSAISVSVESQRVTVDGNIGNGDVSVDGAGQLNYASDFGFSPVHPVNSAPNPSDSAKDSRIIGNIFSGTSKYDIYHPEYTDPINAFGQLGVAAYIGNQATVENIALRGGLFIGMRNVYADKDGVHGWSGRSVMYSVGTGVITLLNAAETGFTALQLGWEGAATSTRLLQKRVTAIADAAATPVLTVTIPNAAHSARLKVTLAGSLGAGGAIGANEATGSVTYDFSVTRTAGVAAVVVASTPYGSAASSVAGAATITVTAAASAIAGAVSAPNTFTVDVTISRGSGVATNHTCEVRAEIANANATGITVT